MALSATVNNGALIGMTGATAPSSITAAWIPVITAGGASVQDAATITNPTTQITSSTRRIFSRQALGTNLILRLKYDSTLTTITSPIVKVFGRSGSDAWQLLYSKGGNLRETLTVDTTNDARDGTYSYTTPSFAVHAWDCLGCDEFLVGIETALAGSTGSVATATIDAKCI